MLYDDAVRGSERFQAKPEAPGMVLRWRVEKLAPERLLGSKGPSDAAAFGAVGGKGSAQSGSGAGVYLAETHMQ